MVTNTSFNVPKAVLNLPTSPTQVLTFAKAVLGAMKDNPRFPSPNPPLDVVEVSITNLHNAEMLAATRAQGAKDARDIAKKQVVSNLFHLCDYVQSVAEKASNATEATSVITSACMSVKKHPQRITPELVAKNTGIPGQVRVAAKPVAHSAAYYWEHSPDQVTWTSVPETMKASIIVEGLPWAKMHYFRFRALTRAGKRDYSMIAGVLVQ